MASRRTRLPYMSRLRVAHHSISKSITKDLLVIIFSEAPSDLNAKVGMQHTNDVAVWTRIQSGRGKKET
jgi:hypothetical protein